MSDIDAAGMSHIGPKTDIVRERVARSWHEGSDHAADEPFGGPLCNCKRVADRIMPMLREAWDRGHGAPCDQWVVSDMCREYHPNPYLEDRHVDQ